MHPQVTELIGQLEAVTAGVRTLGSAATDAAFARRPTPEKWSPAECIAHLNLTTESFLPRFDAILAAHATGPRDESRR